MAIAELSSAADELLERRTLRKVTRRIVPLLMVLYLVNYLDRTNIGFAKLTMNADLGLSETTFGLISGLFFLGYILFEIPSNLALHRFGARVWITRIMATWGIIAAATAFVPDATTLGVLRVLLGIAEAGFTPGILLYLISWFPARQRGQVTAWFFATVPLASVIGAPLSALLIEYGDGVFGLAGWRFMYLVEGLPAVALAALVWFALKNTPQEATWLTPAEKNALTTALARDERNDSPPLSVRGVLTNRRILALGLADIGPAYGVYALAFFLPTVIAGFGDHFGVRYSLLQVGLLTAIPYALGAVGMIAWSRHSDRTGERTWHVALPAILAAVTIPAALYMPHPILAMAALTLGAIGVLATLPTFWSLATHLTGRTAAIGIAAILMMSNLGGFAAPYLTGWLNDTTGTPHAGMWIVGAALLGTTVICLGLKNAQNQNV